MMTLHMVKRREYLSSPSTPIIFIADIGSVNVANVVLISSGKATRNLSPRVLKNINTRMVVDTMLTKAQVCLSIIFGTVFLN
jgi:uncharacterized protein